MQSGAGRDLIESLQQDPTRPAGTNAGSDPARRITIEPDAPTGSFAASERDLNSSSHVLRPQPARANPNPPAGFRQLAQGQNLTEQWRRQPGQTGVSISHGGQTRDYAFGPGQGARVSFPVGSRARSHGIKTDALGNQILSPSFVVLGHELFHAEHGLQGATATSTSDVGANAQTPADIETHQLLAGVSGQGAGEYDEYESTEEYVTVLHNENYLREQYALTARASHLEQGMFITGRLGNLLTRGDLNLSPAERQEIEGLQNALGRQRWLENNRQKARNDPEFAAVYAAHQAELPQLIAGLGLQDMDAVMNTTSSTDRSAAASSDLLNLFKSGLSASAGTVNIFFNVGSSARNQSLVICKVNAETRVILRLLEFLVAFADFVPSRRDSLQYLLARNRGFIPQDRAVGRRQSLAQSADNQHLLHVVHVNASIGVQ